MNEEIRAQLLQMARDWHNLSIDSQKLAQEAARTSGHTNILLKCSDHAMEQELKLLQLILDHSLPCSPSTT